jgi:DHA1 family tetracycline resistance protein-like MFS transporter
MACLQGFAGLIGPLVFSSAFAYVTSPRAAVRFIGAPFAIGALLALLALALTVKAGPVGTPRSP